MTEDTKRMRDVDHTHPHGGDATRRLYERGNEGRTEADDEDEGAPAERRAADD